MTKIGHFKAKLIQKTTLFCVQKKVTKSGHYKAKLIPKIPFGMRKRHLFEVFRRHSRGAGRPAGWMRVTFFSHSRILRTHSEECKNGTFSRFSDGVLVGPAGRPAGRMRVTFCLLCWFGKTPEGAKSGHFKAKLIQKMTLFGVQKKVTKIGHYKAKLIQKRPFGMRKRHQIEVSSRSKRGAGRPAGCEWLFVRYADLVRAPEGAITKKLSQKINK